MRVARRARSSTAARPETRWRRCRTSSPTRARFRRVEVRGEYVARAAVPARQHAARRRRRLPRADGVARRGPARARARESRLGAAGGDRRVLPDVASAASTRTRRRPARAPAAARACGSAAEDASDGSAGDAVVLQYPTAVELAQRLGEPVYDYQLLLDAAARRRLRARVARARRRARAASRRTRVSGWRSAVGAVAAALVIAYQDREAQAVKHKSLAPWLVALVCFGPFVARAIHLLRAAGPVLAAAAAGQPRATARAGAAAAGVAWRRCRRRRASSVAIDLCKNSPCEQQCAQHLGRLLQVQLALGRDQERVQRVVWHVGSLPQLERSRRSPRTRSTSAAGRELVDGARRRALSETAACTWPTRVGIVVLSYPPDVEQKELLRDLKRLLAGSD